MVNNDLNSGGKNADPPSPVAEVGMSEPRRIVTIHDVRQTLNVLRITAGNIGVRLKPVLDAADTAYLERRLGVIDDQIQSLAAMAEVLCASGHDGPHPAG